MKVICFSDTHSQHRKIQYESCNILLFAGDFTCNDIVAEKDLIDFNIWLRDYPAEYKVIIAGNHDTIFEKNKIKAKSILTSAIYLEDLLISINNIRIYGTPFHLREDKWCFGKESEEELVHIYSKIPDCDILLVHVGPYNIMDYKHNKRHVGSKELYKIIKERKIPYVVFGHVHEYYGVYKENTTAYINCSMTSYGNKWKSLKPISFYI